MLQKNFRMKYKLQKFMTDMMNLKAYLERN